MGKNPAATGKFDNIPLVVVDQKPKLPALDGDWAESKTEGWNKQLQEVLNEKDSLQAAAVQVLTKRNEEANRRIQQLEELVNKKDERIERLVDTIINKLGGFDGS